MGNVVSCSLRKEAGLPLPRTKVLVNQHFKFLHAPVAQLDRASVFGTEGWGFESLRVYFPAFLRPSVLGNAGFLLDVRCCSTLRCGLLLATTKIKRLSQLDCISFTPLHTPALAFTRVVEQLATLGRDGSDSKSRYWSKAKWER